MKYAWMDGQSKVYALTEMCVVLDVSISGYRAWKRGGTPDRKRLTDAQTLAVIRAIHLELKGAYGSPRMVRELRMRGFTAGKERVERLMRENGIRARHKRRYKVTTDSKHGLPVAANLLNRNFTPTAPNQVWTSDITYLWTDEGWLYLAIVLDLFNREVIGWSLKPRMTTDMRFPRYFVRHQMNFMQPAFPDFVHSSSDRDTELAIDSRVSNAGGFDYKRLQCIRSWQPSFQHG